MLKTGIKLQLVLWLLLYSTLAFSNAKDSLEINDGPYIFIEDQSLKKVNIVKGEVKETELSLTAYPLTTQLIIMNFQMSKRLPH